MTKKNTLISILILLTFTAVFIFTAVLIWWQYSPSRNEYAVDLPITAAPSDCNDDLTLAVIGDYGDAPLVEKGVADLVHSWNVDYIVTVGDNNYPDGEASTIDKNIGQYYYNAIYPYQGSYGAGASENHFFPTLGNHDWRTGNIDAYLDYFTLPGNERYYDVELGSVHLFVIDSDEAEPDGRTADSVQAQWLQTKMAASNAQWKLVAQHHPPYSSGKEHPSDPVLQWPYAEWGATAVLAGHLHAYERIQRDNILYFINGLGGRWRTHTFDNPPIPGSVVRYNQDFGAMRITADSTCINFTFFNDANQLIDSVTILP